MLGAVFSAVAGAVYKHHKSRKTAIIGAIAGAAAMAVFSVPSNYFITYPAYVQFYHMPVSYTHLFRGRTRRPCATGWKTPTQHD